VGIDLHRRRSVIVRMTGAGERLATVRIENDPVALALEVAKAGPDPEAVLEATYGWYWAADVLLARVVRAGGHDTNISCHGVENHGPIRGILAAQVAVGLPGLEPGTHGSKGCPTRPKLLATCDSAAARVAGPHCDCLRGRQFASQFVSRGRVRRGRVRPGCGPMCTGARSARTAFACNLVRPSSRRGSDHRSLRGAQLPAVPIAVS